MATTTYTYNFINSEYTTDSLKSMRRNFIGTRMTGVHDDVRSKVPKFAKINSATCSIRIKRDGTSDLSLYNHDMAWRLYNESGSVVSTLQSQERAIKRSYTRFSYNCLSYINSENANAGETTSIYCLSFYVSGDLSKKYTYDEYKFAMSYTLPTITINASVNNSSYGKVVTDGSFSLGSAIDVSVSSRDAVIYAIPNEGYEFVRWSDGVTDDYRVIKISEDNLNAHNTVFSFTAEFALKKHTITVTAGTGGTVTGGGTYTSGTSVTLKATPATGYKFSKWSNGSTSTSITVTATANATYTAYFVLETYTITVNATNDSATVSGGGVYTYGEEVTISVFTVEGCKFRQWNDGATEPTRTVIVTGDATYTAEIVTLYQITADFKPTNLYGSTTGSGWYEYGEEVTLTANEEEGYTFTGWEDGVTDATRVVVVTGNATYTAIYEARQCTITINIVPEGAGYVSGAGVHSYGSRVSVLVGVAEGYKFIGLYDENNNKVGNIISVTGDATYTAEFEAVSVTISANASPAEGGTISGTGTYKYGDYYTLTAMPNDGYKFIKWSTGDENPSITRITVQNDESFIAYFEKEAIKKVFVGSAAAKAVHYTAATKTITFVVDGSLPTTTGGLDTVDGYNFAVANSAPANSTAIKGVYVGTKQVFSS